MPDFTFRVMIDGHERLAMTTTFDRLHEAVPEINSMIPGFLLEGPVALLAETSDGVVHILGSWR